MKDKHTSTLIRKKWRKGKQWSCCGKCYPGNLTKPMKGNGHYCSQVKFFKSRDRLILAKQEIRELFP